MKGFRFLVNVEATWEIYIEGASAEDARERFQGGEHIEIIREYDHSFELGDLLSVKEIDPMTGGFVEEVEA